MILISSIKYKYNYQERDERRNPDDSERAQKGIGHNCSQDRKHINAAINHVPDLSSINAVRIELLNHVHYKVASPSSRRQRQPRQSYCPTQTYTYTHTHENVIMRDLSKENSVDLPFLSQILTIRTAQCFKNMFLRSNARIRNK